MLGVDELLAESLPVLISGSVLDYDLTVVVGELEDKVLELLGKLQVVEAAYAFLGDDGTGDMYQLNARPFQKRVLPCGYRSAARRWRTSDSGPCDEAVEVVRGSTNPD